MNLFGILMATFMVYGMEVYNAILRGGFSVGVLVPTVEVVMLIPVVMLVQALWGGPAAAWLQGAVLGGRQLTGRAAILARQLATVAVMCPTMSLVAVFVFKGGLQAEFFSVWGRTILWNFPMALGWQVLVAGPAVRSIVRSCNGAPAANVLAKAVKQPKI